MNTEYDQDIRALYRESTTDGPSAALDQAILSSARAALVAPAKPRSWSRFKLPVQLASVALALMLGLLMQQQLPEREAARARSDPAGAPAAPAAVQAETNALPTAAENKQERGASPAKPVAAAAPTLAENRPKTLAASSRVEPQRQAGPAADIQPAAPAAKAAIAESATPSASGNRLAAPLQDAAAPRAAAKTTPPLPSPEDWLEKIKQLTAEGRNNEARAAAEALHKAYPNYPLPEPVKKLLPP